MGKGREGREGGCSFPSSGLFWGGEERGVPRAPSTEAARAAYVKSGDVGGRRYCEIAGGGGGKEESV